MTDIDELDYQMGSLVADVLDAAEEWADEAVTPGGGCCICSDSGLLESNYEETVSE